VPNQPQTATDHHRRVVPGLMMVSNQQSMTAIDTAAIDGK
jgi:hypothetical protein